jgi:hypothetical protein
VIAAIASTVTKNQTTAQVGVWDCFATDPNGKVIMLGSGTFSSIPNVTLF